MNSNVQRNFGRATTVAIVICSWLAISNHCALMAVAAPVADLQSACPFHSKPVKQKEQSSQVQCCKILRALAPVATKSWTRDDSQFSDVDLRFEEFGPIAPSHRTRAPLLLDTGPPGATSFAELILQQSLLTHAPPVRV